MIDKIILPSDARQKRFLLAVSGGIDSMSMAHIFANNNLCADFAIATVNFSLRAQDSDKDCELVRQWAQNHNCPFYTITFETNKYAEQHAMSVEMAARELRYRWFAQTASQNGYDYIAVAHNLNDSAETLFLNLLRGTGLRGMTGIRQSNGQIIRPLLNISRKEIEQYAKDNSVDYREDYTNKQSIYSRNRIRNEVFPHLQAINPSFLSTLKRDMSHFSLSCEILEDLYNQKQGILYKIENGILYIDIAKLKTEKYVNYWLYRILDDYGFNESQVQQVEQSIYTQSGKRFFSKTHTLVKDRDYIKVYNNTALLGPFESTIRVSVFEREPDFDLVPMKGTLFVDADKLIFPLSCRQWQPSDRFTPFGMKGSKKLSDFFGDLKLDVVEKQNQKVVTTLMENGDSRIVCVAGLRIDNYFRITEQTKRIASISI